MLRLLVEPADPLSGRADWNMAVDEALLRTPGPPTLRFYRWSPAAISLGHFQDPEDFADVLGEHAIVRRPTGGGAIFHDREITFAVTTPACRLPKELPASYVALHGVLHTALAQVGVETRSPGQEEVRTSARPTERWCFADPAPGDLLTPSGAKLCGSAQRRISAPEPRVLHHGSLVLVAPAATPFVGAAATPATESALRSELEPAIALGLAHFFEAESATPAPLTDAERTRAQHLLETRYASPAIPPRRRRSSS